MDSPNTQCRRHVEDVEESKDDLKIIDTVSVDYLAKRFVAFVIVCGIALAIYVIKQDYFVYIIQTIPYPVLLTNRHNKTVQHIVCPIVTGGIGNVMFEFASSYGIARSKGMKIAIQEDHPLLKVFKLKVEVPKNHSSVCDPNRVITRSERQASAFDKNLGKFNNTRDIRLAMYLQSYLYFDKYSSEIRQQFVFKDEIQNKVKNIFNKIFKEKNISRNNLTLVGVHVRRGDYVDNPFGYKVATKQYLHAAVQWYKSRFQNLHFIVASNGMKWTRKNLPKNISVTYLEGNPRDVDMATISSCNHFIATVGTFSWWSGWLTGGNVTYYKWPSKEGTPLRQAYSKDYSDFYYPQWIGI